MRINPVCVNRFILFLLIGFSFFFFIPSMVVADSNGEGESSEKERAISRIYSSHALKAYQNGEFEESKQLLAVSRLFDGKNRDALAIGGLLALKGGELQSSLKLYEKAATIEDDPHYAISLEFIQEELSAVAFRLGLIERAYLYLSGLVNDAELPADTGILYITILEKLGRKEAALEMSSELASRYPKDSEVLEQFLNLNQLFIPPFLTTDDPAEGIRKMEDYSRAVLQMVLGRIDKGSLWERLFEQYERRFGRDPFWALERGIPQLESDEEREALLLQALESYPLQGRGKLVEYRTLTEKVGLEAAFDTYLEGFTGLLESDLNRDGYIEQREMFQNGQIRTYSYDRDQNGVYEFSILFDDGTPLSVSDKGGLIRYSTYPYLKEFVLHGKEGETRYILYPYDEQHPFPHISGLLETISGDEREREGRIDFTLPSPDLLGAKALEIITSITDSELTIYEKPLFQGAGDLVLLRDENDRIIERRVGDQDYTFREKDLDRDGRFELAERYLSDELIEIRLDKDGDGNAEYAESFGERHTVLWDFNDDGVFDCRQFRENDRLIREFSTMLDGSFDYRLEVDD
jgi:hypothetical protein